MPSSQTSVSPSQLLRRLSTALSTDLSDGTELLELTFALVLRNLLAKTKRCSNKVYPLLKILVPYLILLGGIYKSAKQAADIKSVICSAASFVTEPFAAKVVVPASHSLNRDVLAWLAARGLGKDSRSLALARSCEIPSIVYDNEGMPVAAVDDGTNKSTQLSYIPDFGKYYFRFEGHFMSMERENASIINFSDDDKGPKWKDFDPTQPQNLAVRCFPTFHGTGPIKRFLSHVEGFSDPPKANVTTVYRPTDLSAEARRTSYSRSRNGVWSVGANRPARSLDSVALDDSTKLPLVGEVADYLTPEHQRFCANRGYPYRLGLLLYGPPGTGKISFCVALAGHFKLDVYILGLSDKGMCDECLETLFAELPAKCIVLIEDLDSAGLERQRTKDELRDIWNNRDHGDPEYDQYNNFAQFASHSSTALTLSGLLNYLDGPMSKDGRIVCITTNAPDKLDRALIRPGRCDSTVHFGYASTEVCTKLFEHLHTKRADEMVQGEICASDHHDIPSLARKFANAIPGGEKITPAEVQGYLMKHRKDPWGAVNGAAAFASGIIDIKAQGKNVAGFANEIEKPAKTVTDFPSFWKDHQGGEGERQLLGKDDHRIGSFASSDGHTDPIDDEVTDFKSITSSDDPTEENAPVMVATIESEG